MQVNDIVLPHCGAYNTSNYNFMKVKREYSTLNSTFGNFIRLKTDSKYCCLIGSIGALPK